MPVIKSHIKTSSDEFKQNSEKNHKLAAELEERLAQTREGGGPEARAKHEKRGKLL